MKTMVKRTIQILILPCIVFLIFSVFSAGRFGLHSFPTVLNQSLIPCLLGFGIFLFMRGGISDLSSCAQMILAGMLSVRLFLRLGVFGILFGCLLGCFLMGIFGGTVLTCLNLPPFSITFGLVMIYEALPDAVGFGVAEYIPSEIAQFGRYPYNIIITVFCALIMWIICNHTKFYLHICAVGCEERLATNAGIHVRRVRFAIYLTASFFYGVAAFLNICYSCSVTRTYNLDTMWSAFQVLMGVIVGMQLQNVCNIVIGIVVGQFCMSSIFSGLIAIGLPDTMQRVTTGVFLLAVIAFSVNKKSIFATVGRVFPFMKKHLNENADITQFNM